MTEEKNLNEEINEIGVEKMETPEKKEIEVDKVETSEKNEIEAGKVEMSEKKDIEAKSEKKTNTKRSGEHNNRCVYCCFAYAADSADSSERAFHGAKFLWWRLSDSRQNKL